MFDKSSIEQAKEYIKEMANGINPITGEVVSDNDIINDVKISRCLFYVSEVLDKYSDILENEIKKAERKERRSNRIKKSNFYATPEDLADFNYSSEPLIVSEIVNNINLCFQNEEMKKLSSTAVTNWLVSKDFLIPYIKDNGKASKKPTSLGEELGIIAEPRFYRGKQYMINTFNINAQRFIIENIEEISKSI